MSLDPTQDLSSLLQARRPSQEVTDRLPLTEHGKHLKPPFPVPAWGKCFLIANCPILNLQRSDRFFFSSAGPGESNHLPQNTDFNESVKKVRSPSLRLPLTPGTTAPCALRTHEGRRARDPVSFPAS